jgi:murein L,D-transpeptidase YcbB/YkuD
MRRMKPGFVFPRRRMARATIGGLVAGAFVVLPVNGGVQAGDLRSALADWPGQGPHAHVIAEFYADVDFRFVWYREGQPADRIGALLEALRLAAAEGLDPADYRPDALQRQCVATPPAEPAACELALTASFLRYAQDVGYGVLRPPEVDPNWAIPQQALPSRELLAQVAASEDLRAIIAQLPPPHADYRRLRDALAQYRAQRHAQEWPSLPAGPRLRPGDRGPRVLDLRQRLGAQEPGLLQATLPDVYDDHLVAAVERFQQLHGLDVDGIVGKSTRAALNVPRATRIAQIALNMERWRWLPRQLGERHILVNIAGFNLTLVRSGQPALRLRTISGREDRKSVAFQSHISHLVFNPDWTVPRRLAVEDMLPQLQRDPLSLVQKQIRILRPGDDELVEVDPLADDWKSYNKSNFPFMLRQAPGPHNSLGRVKFMMPNPYAIYIHDTPAQRLFDKNVRTLSSGCIRVERALDLASLVLKADEPAPDPPLRRYLDTQETVQVPVVSRMPVYLVYFTAWVDEQGELRLYDDVYGRDSPLLERFSQR